LTDFFAGAISVDSLLKGLNIKEISVIYIVETFFISICALSKRSFDRDLLRCLG
jgi:hypothetical protein